MVVGSIIKARQVPPFSYLVALVLWGVVAGVFFFRFRPAWVALSQLFEPLLAGAVVLLAAYAAGGGALDLARAVFRKLAGLLDSADAPSAADRTLVGLPVLGTLVTLIAWGGRGVVPAIFVLCLVLAAVGGIGLWRSPPSACRISTWGAILLGPPIAVAAIAAMLPVNSPDELIYKLTVPQEFLLRGAMVELPLNSHSYFAAALAQVSLAALVLSEGIAAKWVHFGLFLLTLGALHRVARRIYPPAPPSEEAATWVVAVVAWTPALAIVAGWAWAEWGVLGLLFLSYESWHRFRLEPQAAHVATCVAALAGAAAVKYTALPWIAIFVVFAIFHLASEHGGRVARIVASSALLLGLFGGLSYFRNWIWTGSPAAPFLLGGAPPIGNYRSDGALTGWQELIRGFDIVHLTIVDDALGILLPLAVLLSPLAALAFPRSRDLWWIGFLPLPALLVFAPMSRLLLVSVVPLAVLGAAYMARGWSSLTAGWRRAVSLPVGLALAGQMLLVLYVFQASYQPFDFVVGKESEAEYLARTRSFMKPYQWLAESSESDALVLLLGENRSYYLDRPSLSAGNFDGPRVAAFLADFADSTAFAVELQRQGVTHVLVHWPWVRVTGQGKPPSLLEREYVLLLPPESARMLQSFVDSEVTRVYEDNEYSIYQLPL